ncbi:ComEC family competence protein [Candidatus Peribacteria bacterium]|nr:ComEC family competence protein [Candidatus Peribacteria bacterium]
MRPSHLSYAFLGSFLAASFGFQWWQLPAYPWWMWGVLGIFVFFGIVGIYVNAARNAALVIPAIMGIAFAMICISRTTHLPSLTTADSYADGSLVAIKGTIADDADRRPLKTNYIVEIELLRRGTETLKVSGRALMTTVPGSTLFEYGDRIVATGKLEKPKNTEDFRYDNYLSLKEVYSLMPRAQMVMAGAPTGSQTLRSMYRLRRALEERINLLLTEPHASLLAGLLLGSRRGIPADLQEDFKNTGLTHLVAISGYNITMLITVMGTLLFWLPLRWRFIPSVLLITGFTLLTGASASAVRAAVMGILGLLALQLGRVQTTRLAVLWTAFFMLAWNPKTLWYDAGFQLSFLALLGVLEIAPLLKPWLTWLPETLGIRESLCLTLAAQMLASAWIFFLFGELSLIAPISNLLAPPLVPAASLLGFLSMAFSAVWMPLGRFTAALAWLPLTWITGVAHLLGSLPFAAVTMEGFPAAGIIAYYFCIAAWVVVKNMDIAAALRGRGMPVNSAPGNGRC